MQTHTDRTPENRKHSANNVTQNQNTNKSILKFLDNRPEAVSQRKLQEMANNSHRVRQLKSFQQMIDKYALKYKPTVQMFPEKQENGTFTDSKHPGMILTVNTEKSENDEGRTFYDASGVSNEAIVYFEDGCYYTEENKPWFPNFSHQFKDQSHYLCTEYDDVVDISKIKIDVAGNEQDYKKETLKKSISGGYLPAITVTQISGPEHKYQLQDGRNRIAVSLEEHYTKIPIKIMRN